MSNTISALLHSSNAQMYSKPKNVFGILGKKMSHLKQYTTQICILTFILKNNMFLSNMTFPYKKRCNSTFVTFRQRAHSKSSGSFSRLFDSQRHLLSDVRISTIIHIFPFLGELRPQAWICLESFYLSKVIENVSVMAFMNFIFRA